MPYIKTSLTDREVHLLLAAVEATGTTPVTQREARNATLSSHVGREYAGLIDLLTRFVEDFPESGDLDAPPARVKPFMNGQKLFKFNVYSRRSANSTTMFEEIPLPSDSYAILHDVDWAEGLEGFRDFSIWRFDDKYLVGSASAIERARASLENESCDEEECVCDEGFPCDDSTSRLFNQELPLKYSAYIQATSPIMEYLTTERRRKCRDEMLADMSGSLLPLLSRDEVRAALDINRSGLRYREAPSLLFTHKLMSLASIANTATEQQLENTQTIATIDVIL